MTKDTLPDLTDALRDAFLAWSDEDGESDLILRLRDAVAAAGFVRAPDWEYGASINGGDPEPVWDKYPGDEGRANLEEDPGVRLLRRRKAGTWEQIND